jgi:hydroxymethylbilane synthase
MKAVDGSCRMPVAAYAVRDGDALWLRAMLAEPDGSRLRTSERRAPFPRDEEAAAFLGATLGAELKHR